MQSPSPETDTLLARLAARPGVQATLILSRTTGAIVRSSGLDDDDDDQRPTTSIPSIERNSTPSIPSIESIEEAVHARFARYYWSAFARLTRQSSPEIGSGAARSILRAS